MTGDLADLIFVFFDPMGQALCKRTLNLVEELNDTHAERIRFYLTKADEAGHEADRQRVMMQIVQVTVALKWAGFVCVKFRCIRLPFEKIGQVP